jgi:NhaA family Na+:H+ antiporter
LEQQEVEPVVLRAMREFLRLEAASGVLLLAAAALALLFSNSALSPLYDALLGTPVEVRVGTLEIAKPLLLWVNDGLMAVFFLLVGLEVKREVLEGHLSRLSDVALPALAALGGMAAPALVYTALNYSDPISMRGWAIPTATDIAFALGVLALLGRRVPPALKLFLLTLAIIDDLGAVIIIALFYTTELATGSLIGAGVALAGLTLLAWRGVTNTAAYVLLGFVLWVSVLKSGVHATLAGVALAMFIPLRGREGEPSPLRSLEHDLHPPVAYGILPFFAFVNAGVSLEGVTVQALLHPVPLGVAAGLFLGKQVGVFGASWLAVRLGLASLPLGVGWGALYGVSVLCGVGFTMSLFITSLAFEMGGGGPVGGDRLGILVGSGLSAVVGYALLWVLLPREPTWMPADRELEPPRERD